MCEGGCVSSVRCTAFGFAVGVYMGIGLILACAGSGAHWLQTADMNAFTELLIPEDTSDVVPDASKCVTHCSNTCNEAFNGYCNDGGSSSDPYTQNSRPSICPYGTDCYDCGTRYGRRLLETTPTQFVSKLLRPAIRDLLQKQGGQRLNTSRT